MSMSMLLLVVIVVLKLSLVTEDFYNLVPFNSDDPGGSCSVVGESCGICHDIMWYYVILCDIMWYCMICDALWYFVIPFYNAWSTFDKYPTSIRQVSDKYPTSIRQVSDKYPTGTRHCRILSIHLYRDSTGTRQGLDKDATQLTNQSIFRHKDPTNQTVQSQAWFGWCLFSSISEHYSISKLYFATHPPTQQN